MRQKEFFAVTKKLYRTKKFSRVKRKIVNCEKDGDVSQLTGQLFVGKHGRKKLIFKKRSLKLA